MANHQLPMRTGVGIIVLNNNNQVFVGKRKDNPGDKWQMPQGGVDKGEDFITAMRRELIEETSIKNIKILKEIQNMYQYELPKNLVGITGTNGKSSVAKILSKNIKRKPSVIPNARFRPIPPLLLKEATATAIKVKINADMGILQRL